MALVYDLVTKRTLLKPQDNETLVIDAHVVNPGIHRNISCDFAMVRGRLQPIKLHLSGETIWLGDNQWKKESNVTLPKGTKLVVRPEIYWGGLHQNNLYLESLATRYVGRGWLIELQEDAAFHQTDPELGSYQAITFEQLDRLYQSAVPYDTEIPDLGPNNFNYAPPGMPYDHDNDFDRDWSKFMISVATEEQLKTYAYHKLLCMFGISLRPIEERVIAK